VKLVAYLGRSDLMPPGIRAKVLGARDWSWLAPGMPAAVRVTTDPDCFEQHRDSAELWSSGSPVFPTPEAIAESHEMEGLDWRLLTQPEQAAAAST
jgi:hypothetical protein